MSNVSFSLFLTKVSAIGMASSKGRIVNQENSGTDGVGIGKLPLKPAGMYLSTEIVQKA